jgi:hypothetical protein
MQMTLAAFVSTLFLLTDASVTGTWNLGLQGDHVIPTPLVLKQDGKAVSGTIGLPTQHSGQRVEVKLTGTFDDGVLKITGEVENAKEPTTVDIEGRFGDDGALEGTLALHGRSIPWTAERLKERK